MRIPPKAVSMAVPDAGGKKGVAPLNKGLSPTGDWGWTDRISVAGPFRAAPERQRGFREETEAVEVPAERSGAACPDGAVTAGDWG